MSCAMCEVRNEMRADHAMALRICAALNRFYFYFVRFFAGAFYYAGFYYFFFTEEQKTAHRMRLER